MTSEQIKKIGIDIISLKQKQKDATDQATKEFETEVMTSWFTTDHMGYCEQSDAPAKLVEIDRLRGLNDRMEILERGDDGNPDRIQIFPPFKSGTKSTNLYFYGIMKCNNYRKK